MDITIVCPNGHELVTEDKYAGRKIRCPHCQSVVLVQAPTGIKAGAPRKPSRRDENEAVEEEDERPRSRKRKQEDEEEEERAERPSKRGKRREEEEEEEEEKPKKKGKKAKKRQQLKLVYIGLALLYWMLLCISVIPLLLFILTIGVAILIDPATASLINLLCIVSLGAGPVLAITGAILCCFAPEKANARIYMILSLVTDFAAPPLAFFLAVLGVGIFLSAIERGHGEIAAIPKMALFGGSMLIASPLAAMAISVALFMRFLAQFAHYMGEAGTESEAHDIAKSFALHCIAPPPIVFVLLFIPMCIGGPALVALMIYWGIAMIAFLWRTLQLISFLRQSIRLKMGFK